MADSDNESFHSATEDFDEEKVGTASVNAGTVPKIEKKQSEEKDTESSSMVPTAAPFEPSRRRLPSPVGDKASSSPSSEDDERPSREEDGWGEFTDDELDSNDLDSKEENGDWADWNETTKSRKKQKLHTHLSKGHSVSETKTAEKNDEESDDWFEQHLVKPKPPKKDPVVANSEEKQATSIWDWTGLNDVVHAVGEGLSNVVESGLGLPNPETMAKLSMAERRKLMEEAQHIKEPEPSLSSDNESISPESGIHTATSSTNVGSFGGLFSGIVHGSLDVLESLGKKTFETLTVADQAESDRRRFILEPNKGPTLSSVLKELRIDKEVERDDNADNTFTGSDTTMATSKFNTNFVSLFEKSEGMVHLEGLELISLGQQKSLGDFGASDSTFDEKMLEFCVEDVSECSTEDFHVEIKKSIKYLGLPYKADSVFQVDKDLADELSRRQQAVDSGEEIVVEPIHEAAISALAKLTAHSLQALHKLAQLMVIAHQVPEMESLFAFTYLLCRRLSFYASQYANILSLVEHPREKVDEVVTAIFLECSNACHYVRKALELLRPFYSA
jgi:hypothetical protein